MKCFPNISKIFLLIVFIILMLNYAAHCHAQSYASINESVALYYNFDQNPEGALSVDGVTTLPYHRKLLDNSGNSCYGLSAGGGAYVQENVPRVLWDRYSEDPLWAVDNDYAKSFNSVYFDGNDYIQVGADKVHEIGWSDYSVILWFKAETEGGLFYADKDAGLGIDIAWNATEDIISAQLLHGKNGPTTVSVSDASVAYSTWYLLSVRLDRDGSMQLDITSEGGTVGDITSAAIDISSAIANITNSNNGFIGWEFTGIIDEFGIYKDYLTDAEIEWVADQNEPPQNMHNNSLDNGLYNPEMGESGIDCKYCEDEDIILDYYGYSSAIVSTSPSTFQEKDAIEYLRITAVISGELFGYMYPTSNFSGMVNFDGRGSGDWNYYTTWSMHDSLGEHLLALEAQNFDGIGGQGFGDLGFGFISHGGLVGNHPTNFHVYLDRVIMKLLDDVLYPVGTDGHVDEYYCSGNSYGTIVAVNSMLFNNDKYTGGMGSLSIAFDLYLDQKAWWVEHLHDYFCGSVTNLGWRYDPEDAHTNYEVYKLHTGKDSGTHPVVSVLGGNGTRDATELFYQACTYTNAGNYRAPLVITGGNGDYRQFGDIWGPPNHEPAFWPPDLLQLELDMLAQHGGSAECRRTSFSGPVDGTSWIEWLTEYDKVGVPPPVAFGASGSGYPSNKVNWDHVAIVETIWDDLFEMDSNDSAYDAQSGAYCTLMYEDGWGTVGRFGEAVILTTKTGTYNGYPFAVVGTDGGELNVLRYNPTLLDPDGGADDAIEGWYITERSIDSHKLNYGVMGLAFTSENDPQDYLLAADCVGELHWYDCPTGDPSGWTYTAFTDYQYTGGGVGSGISNFGREVTSLFCAGDMDSNGYDEFWMKNWFGTVFCVEVQGTVLVTRFAQNIAPWVSLFDVQAMVDRNTLAIGTTYGDFRVYEVDTSTDVFTLTEVIFINLRISPWKVKISEGGERIFAVTRNTEFYDPQYPHNDSADLYNAGEAEGGNGHQLLYAFDKGGNILDRIKLYPSASGYDGSAGSSDRPTEYPDNGSNPVRGFEAYYNANIDHILLGGLPPRIIRFDTTNGFVRGWINKTMDYVDFTYDFDASWEGTWQANGIDIPQPYYDVTETLVGDTNWVNSNYILTAQIFDLEGDSDKEFVVMTLGGWWHTFSYDWTTDAITDSVNLPQLIKESWGPEGVTDTFKHDGGADYVNTARVYAIDLSSVARIGGLNQYSPMKACDTGGYNVNRWDLLRASDVGGVMVWDSSDIDGAVMSQEGTRCITAYSGGMVGYATTVGTPNSVFFTVDGQLIEYTDALAYALGSGVNISTRNGGVCECGDNTYLRWGQVMLGSEPPAVTSPAGDPFPMPTNHCEWFSGPVFSDSSIPQKWQQVVAGELHDYYGTYQMDYDVTDNFLTSTYHDNQGGAGGEYGGNNNPELAVAGLSGIVGVLKPSYMTTLDSYDQFIGGVDRRGTDDTDDWETTDGVDGIPDIAGTSNDGSIVLTADYMQDGYLWYTDLGHYCQGLAIGDVDDDGINEIVVGVMMGDYDVTAGTGVVTVDPQRRGHIYVLEINEAGVSHQYPYTDTYSVSPVWELAASEYIPTGPSSLIIEDVKINSDPAGTAEIIVGSVDGRMYILKYDSADNDLDIVYSSTKYGMFTGVHNQIYTGQAFGTSDLEIWIGGSDGVRLFSVQ